MFSFHKPKIYRSINGCCICRAKSSSSRFTDSIKYEDDFEKCFRIRERRQGEICNACVLLVKRWKKLPAGTNRHWNHVVDARAGPGTKSTLKIKNRISPSKHKYKSPLKSRRPVYNSIPSPNILTDEFSGYEDSLDKTDLFSRNTTDSDDSDNENSSQTRRRHISKRKTAEIQISPFLDLNYWKKTEVCCGTIFKGLNGEVLVDPQFLRPCLSCRKGKDVHKDGLKRSQSLEDTDSNSSNSSNPLYGDLDFFDSNSNQMEPDSPPSLDSPEDPASPEGLDEDRLDSQHGSLQYGDSKMDFPTPPCMPIAMEC